MTTYCYAKRDRDHELNRTITKDEFRALETKLFSFRRKYIDNLGDKHGYLFQIALA